MARARWPWTYWIMGVIPAPCAHPGPWARESQERFGSASGIRRSNTTSSSDGLAKKASSISASFPIMSTSLSLEWQLMRCSDGRLSVVCGRSA
jgi:hypothetical protein